MQAMGLAEARAALYELRLGLDIIEFDSPTATSQQAADNVGCQLGQIVKSLGFMLDKTCPLLVLASGDQAVDERKLAARFSVGRKKVRMMNREQCLTILGYAPGGVPPIGHRRSDFAVLIDATLQRFDTVYAAGGAPHAIFPIALDDLQRATGGTFADIARG